MKEFLVGLFFLLVVSVMAGLSLLLLPFFMLLAFFLRIILVLALGIFGIWLLGRLIILFFEEFKKEKK